MEKKAKVGAKRPMDPAGRTIFDIDERSNHGGLAVVGKFDYLRKHVFVYDHSKKEAHHPMRGEIQWPIIWLLGRYKEKHLFCGDSCLTKR